MKHFLIFENSHVPPLKRGAQILPPKTTTVDTLFWFIVWLHTNGIVNILF